MSEVTPQRLTSAKRQSMQNDIRANNLDVANDIDTKFTQIAAHVDELASLGSATENEGLTEARQAVSNFLHMWSGAKAKLLPSE